MPLQPGQTLVNGQYRVDVEDHILGRGGFGLVYRAYDTLIHKWVAIKELDPRLVDDEQWLKRFRIEARATMELTHPHIARTHNVFTEGGNYYIVMEYLPGGSLQDRLPAGQPLPIDDALRITAQVCQGLEQAHGQGIVHNDLKPANILFDAQGRAKVADFGVAHVGEGMITRSWSTASGTMAGTLPYMSPEQTEGVRDDPRTDVYALGAIMYRMFTGRAYLDFDDRPTPAAVAANVRLIQDAAPLPPISQNPRLPAWIDDLILKALAKVPGSRFQSAEQVRHVLGMRQPAPKAKGPSRTPCLVWLVAGIAALLALILTAVLAVLLLGGNGGDKTQPTGGPIVVLDTATLAASATDSLVPTAAPEATIPPQVPATPNPPTPLPSSTRPPPTATTAPTSEPQPGPVIEDRVFVVVYRLSDGVSLRPGPGTGYAKITDLYAGSLVVARGAPVWGPEDRVWWPVSTASGDGWMAEQSNNWRLLKPRIEAGDSLVVVNAQGAGDLSLRDNACQRIAVLGRGDELLVSAGPDDLCDEPGSTISQDGRAWWNVTAPGGQEGWVADFASTPDHRMLVAPHWYAEWLGEIGNP